MTSPLDPGSPQFGEKSIQHGKLIYVELEKWGTIDDEKGLSPVIPDKFSDYAQDGRISYRG